MVDGDKCLLIKDKTYYEVAKRNMKNTVPLYYEMAKAKPKLINRENLYTGLVEGYKYGNVGQYSNKITVVWNELNPDISLIKLLTCLNNFYIDGAKTGYMPKVSKDTEERLKVANTKVPYFFKFAKDKDDSQVKGINNSTVNRICKEIESIPIKRYCFKQHGKFDYKVLLNNKDIIVNQELVDYYIKIEKEKNLMIINSDLDRRECTQAMYRVIIKEMESKANELNINYIDMVDMIVEYIYGCKKNNKKKVLWDIFGEQILINMRKNIKNPIEHGIYRMCETCGTRFRLKAPNSNQMYCNKCIKKMEKEKYKKYNKKRSK